MSPWTDIIDWSGGYPFEVAKPDSIIEFYKQKGFSLQKFSSIGSQSGNNQFVFRR
jgi:hypothetical protein